MSTPLRLVTLLWVLSLVLPWQGVWQSVRNDLAKQRVVVTAETVWLVDEYPDAPPMAPVNTNLPEENEVEVEVSPIVGVLNAALLLPAPETDHLLGDGYIHRKPVGLSSTLHRPPASSAGLSGDCRS